MAAKTLALRCQFKGGQRKVIKGLTDQSTVKEFQEEIFALTGVAPHQQRVLTGFPPKELPIQNETSNTLSIVGLRSGDTVIVEENASQPKVVEGKVNTVRLIRKVVPADNSCLFASLSYVLCCGEVSLANEMRQCAANEIARDTNKYNDAVLGTTNQEYCKWLLNPEHWGGAIELDVLSKFYQVEINVADIMTGRMDRYGEVENYMNRVFLLYDGIHYDPMGYEDSSNPGVALQTAFPVTDDGVVLEALAIAEDAKKKRQYTDLAGFSLRCLICSTPLTGQTEAQKHAKMSGHMNFGEVRP